MSHLLIVKDGVPAWHRFDEIELLLPDGSKAKLEFEGVMILTLGQGDASRPLIMAPNSEPPRMVMPKASPTTSAEQGPKIPVASPVSGKMPKESKPAPVTPPLNKAAAQVPKPSPLPKTSPDDALRQSVTTPCGVRVVTNVFPPERAVSRRDRLYRWMFQVLLYAWIFTLGAVFERLAF